MPTNPLTTSTKGIFPVNDIGPTIDNPNPTLFTFTYSSSIFRRSPIPIEDMPLRGIKLVLGPKEDPLFTV